MIQLFRTLSRFSTTRSFYDFPTIDGKISLGDANHIENKKAMDEVNNSFVQLLERTKSVDSKNVKKLEERGKFTVRGRIEKLLDAGSPFLELSALAGHEMYGSDDVKSGGMVTGIGIINKKFCMIVANDPTVKGYVMGYVEGLITRSL